MIRANPHGARRGELMVAATRLSMPSPELSLVLACYNEEPILVQCVGGIVRALEDSGIRINDHPDLVTDG